MTGRPEARVAGVQVRPFAEFWTLLRPGVQTARDLPHLGIRLEPRLGAFLPGPRNDVEAPQHLARPGVVGNHVTRDVHRPLFVDGRVGKVRRRAGMHRDRRNQDVADDGHGRRVGHPAFTRQSRPLVPAQVRCQINHAILPEARHLSPGLRVERDEHVAVHDDKDPFVARAIRPVGDAAARGSRQRIDDVEPSQQLSGRAPVPQQLARGGIECHDIAIDARRRVHHAIDDQRTDLHLVRGPWTEVPRRPAPGHAKIADVGGVDLICGRISRRTGVAAEEPPFDIAFGRAGSALPSQGGRQSYRRPEGDNGQKHSHFPRPHSGLLSKAVLLQRAQPL